MERKMAGKWLRNIVDGTIYGWNEILAENPKIEEVTEEQAFPEKFITKEQKTRKPKISLKTKEVVKPDDTSIELAEEVTRSVEKARTKKSKK
jgi:hypothetical protein